MNGRWSWRDCDDERGGVDVDLATLRAWTAAVSARVWDHLDGLDAQPTCGDVSGRGLQQLLSAEPPAEPADVDAVLRLLFEELIPRSYNTAAPGYFGFIPAGGLVPAALADLIAGVTNRYTGIWATAPALVQLEADTLDWFRDWVGFPPATRGVYTTGGSMATFSGIVCARQQHLRAELRRGVVYTSAQAHVSVVKSAFLAGLMPDQVRVLPVDDDYRLRVDALVDAVRADRQQGRLPFLVVATAGTTGTGTVDPLSVVADVCAAEGLWLHVDAAYGGFFMLCAELRPVLAGLSRADSLTLDPHKGLFLPYGTGALLVRDGAALRAAHAGTAGYLPATPDGPEVYDPSQYGPDLSSGFPGLRVWLSVQLLGMAAFIDALREKRELAVHAAGTLAEVPGVRLATWPELSLFAFHLAAAGGVAEENRLTRCLVQRVNTRGRVLLTGTVVDGRYLARVCVLSFRTHRPQVDVLVGQLAEESARLLAGS